MLNVYFWSLLRAAHVQTIEYQCIYVTVWSYLAAVASLGFDKLTPQIPAVWIWNQLGIEGASHVDLDSFPLAVHLSRKQKA